jgi:phosphatidate cytidylyltransferase
MLSHAKRWITALIAVPILFWTIAWGGKTAFAVLIILASLVGIAEYNRMAFGREDSAEKAVAGLAALFFPLAAFWGDRELLLALVAFSVMAVFILNLLRARKGALEMNSPARAVLGIVYIPLLISHLILIRNMRAGELWVFYVLVVAFVGDVAAYYAGRSLGKRKLLLEVSPGKTVEGTVALMIGSTVGSIVFISHFFPALPIFHAAFLGMIGGVIGQLGDLTESALKREAGIKDSGALLPGHGGILDRLDCLLFISPFVFYYKEFIIK